MEKPPLILIALYYLKSKEGEIPLSYPTLTFHFTYADYRLYYPIRNSNDFNWENAYGDRVNQTVSTNGKSNFTKLMYELGIWSEADVLYLGATKK